ncbi:bifunctional aldolase/short-chain dehydrogenase [Oxyplasma meridianum]|uniref:Bifunctional aldolase/short-chain dehydrogenase n=1 Tax=Oxyplasma meridianum TaxID=3073602 RepID=A0AAX4NEZ9_9ARCH
MQSKWENQTFKDDLDERVYSSHLLGSVPDLVLHGGGNTSIKREEILHTGKKAAVLRVKGSGWDLATIKREGFTGIRMDDLLAAKDILEMTDQEMVDYMKKSMVDPSEPSPSVETFLHAFLPFKFVDHSHADSILAITNRNVSQDEIKSIFGNVVVIPYSPPGFKLARSVLERLGSISPDTEGIILEMHGLFTFGDSAKESYERHIHLVTVAEDFIKKKVNRNIFTQKFQALSIESISDSLPAIRGMISKRSKKILNICNSPEAIEIACSEEAEKFTQRGPATPDMIIRTKHDYIYCPDVKGLESQVAEYEKKYEDQYSRYVSDYPMHDPFPPIIVVRGTGIITSGISAKEAEIVRDQFVHSMRVNSIAEKLSGQRFIDLDLSYSMEYWPLEEAKLKKFKPMPLQGCISLVTGAANGIGYVASLKLAQKGSAIVMCDIDPEVSKKAQEIETMTRSPVLPYVLDISSEQEIRAMFHNVRKKFGGVDIVFNNAGILKSAAIEDLDVKDLDRHYAIIGRGSFIISQEAFRIMKAQGIGGNIVFNITKNLTNPGPEMTSYGSAKAFAAYVCHYVAKEGGKYGIRANIINPDKVFKGSKIWENGVLEARARAKGQTVDEYKTQNLLRREVLPEHVANVLLALVDEETFGATTDAMIPVDGGVK